jgi:hypothetical protein
VRVEFNPYYEKELDMKSFGAKEWALVVDAVLSLAVYFVGKYFAVAVEDLKFVIAALQPILMLYIGSVAFDDVNKLRMEVRG